MPKKNKILAGNNAFRFFEHMPKDIIFEIFKYLNPSDVFQVNNTCSKFRSICQHKLFSLEIAKFKEEQFLKKISGEAACSVMENAILFSNVDQITKAISEGWNFNIKIKPERYRKQMYPIHLAINIYQYCPKSKKKAAFQIVKMLIENGADLFEKDEEGQTPKDYLVSGLRRAKTIKKRSKELLKWIEETIMQEKTSEKKNNSKCNIM